jgi:hypothetical protein
MEIERAALVDQAVAGVASLERLGAELLPAASRRAPAALARLSTAELATVAASLAILLDGARRLDERANHGRAG